MAENDVSETIEGSEALSIGDDDLSDTMREVEHQKIKRKDPYEKISTND